MMAKFPVTVTADLPGSGKFRLDGDVGPLDQTDAALTPLDAKLHVESLSLASTGILDPSLGLGGILDLDGTLASQNGEAKTKGTAKLSKALLIAGGSPATVPVTVNFDTSYDLRKFAGVLHPSLLKIGSAAAHLNGTYENAGDAASLNIQLAAKDMPAKDLEAFLPALAITLPKGSSLQAGTLNANLHIAGPTNKLVTTGDVGLFNGKLADFDLGSKMSAVSALTGVKTGKDLEIEKLTTNLRMAPDGMQASDFLAVVPSIGSLAGDGTIDAKNNMDFKMAATLTTAAGTIASPVSGAAGILGRVTGGGSGCSKGTTVPFQIHGTTSEPKFVPNVGGIAKGMLKSQLGCAGSSVAGPAEKIPASSAVDAIGGLFHKKKSQ
jgi:AsmA protein